MVEEEKEFSEKVIQIKRVSRKVKGGNRISFSALVAVGDKKGKVGIGLGKSSDVRSAIQKAVRKAKRSMFAVSLRGTTIPHEIRVKYGAAKILLKPAPRGSGLIAGGPVRVVAELAGIKDLSAKILGTRDKTNNAYATVTALKKLRCS